MGSFNGTHRSEVTASKTENTNENGKEQEPCEGAGEAVVLSKPEAADFLDPPEAVPRVQDP